jgi:putative inorganic carbon (HCO3(-)) transporter
VSRVGLRGVVRRWDWLLVVGLAGVMLFPEAGKAWRLLLLVVVLGVQWWAWGQALPVTPLNPAILLVAVMTGVSMLVTPDPSGSLGKVSGVLLGMMVFFTVAQQARNRQGWLKALGGWCVAGMGVALVGLVATRWFSNKLTFMDAVTSQLPVRLTGLMGAEEGIQPNELAGALVWVVPVVAMGLAALAAGPKWLASRSGRGKVRAGSLAGWAALLSVTVVLCGGVVVLAQSRGGYLALALATIVMVVMLTRGKWRWMVVGLLGVAIIAGGVVVSQVGMQTLVDQVIDSLPVGNAAVSLGTMNGRVEIWKRVVWAMMDAPLTGMGMNVFRKAVYLIYPMFQLPASYDVAHAHNELLQAALDLGIPGLIGFMAIYVGAVGMLARTMQAGGTMRLLALGLLGGLLAHFIFGMTDAVALGAKPGFLFWWLLGMVYGLYEQSRPVKVVRNE